MKKQGQITLIQGLGIIKIRAIILNAQQFIFVVVVFTCCTAKPIQPPLTKLEGAYFKKLSKIHSCYVTRELENISKSEYGAYTIIFDSLSLYSFENYDSLKRQSLPIAQTLHNQILRKEFDYHYKEIIVFYTTPTKGINSKIVSFTFQIVDL